MTRGKPLPHDWFPRPRPPGVSIGESSWLHSSFAFLHHRHEAAANVRIGEHSGIYRGSFFDLGPNASVEIGDYATMVGVIIATAGRVVIGSYAFLAHEVVIADSEWAVPPGAKAGGGAPATIVVGENAWVGARAVLLGGTRIGEGAIVGAAAVVRGDIPPFAIAAGNPARVVGRVR